MPPMLLALDGAADVGHLLSLAGQTLKSAAGSDGGVAPHVAFLPDGTVLPKVTKTSAIAPGSVLVLGCGEPFDAAKLPARARRMHVTQQQRQREIGPLVRPPPTPRSLSPLPNIYPRSAQPQSDSMHEQPWKFSPSGRWESPLALRNDRL